MEQGRVQPGSQYHLAPHQQGVADPISHLPALASALGTDEGDSEHRRNAIPAHQV